MLLKLHMYFVFCVVNFEIPSKWMGFRCPCLNGHEFQIDFKINDTWSKPVRNVGWYKVIFLSEKNIAPPPRPDPWKRELLAHKHRDQFRRFQGRNFISKLQNPIDMAFFFVKLIFSNILFSLKPSVKKKPDIYVPPISFFKRLFKTAS